MNDIDYEELHHHDEHVSEEAWNPDWMELTSVGIDIGSSTSHLMFSRLFLQRRSIQLSSRFEVVGREVLYRSPVLLTPYVDPETIDTDALAEFIATSYAEAGMDASQVDTGAVICTGEAVRKKNAEAITRMFSNQGDKFVCATAGPNLEAVLAAHGSGAVDRSSQKTIMNVDVGGGTCKVAIVRDGTILETAAINVGSRLVAWDEKGQIQRIEEAGAKIAKWSNVQVALGRVLSDEDKAAMASTLADILFNLLERKALSPMTEELLVTPPLHYQGALSEIQFSGGVAEYIYGKESQAYGDLGPLMGDEVRKRIPALGVPTGESVERLRATVIGCSQYTVQVSSSTIFLSRKDLLPIRDLLVVAPHFEGDHLGPQDVAKAIERAFQRFDLSDHQRPVAICLPWRGDISYDALKTLALGVIAAKDQWDHQDPLVLVFDRDLAALVGALLKEELELKQDIVAVDEIDVRDFDFIDIGHELGHSQAVPVVVKSLVFKA